MRTAKIVIGTQFGDEGKGLVVDNLCSPESLVVRFSGGPNAGHTVIRNGIKHIFSSYGSGTLKGCPTLFTEDTAIYLSAIHAERAILKAKGIAPELFVHPHTKIITPYDVIANRDTEIKNNHGSCGIGYSLTMKRNIETPYKLHACDLFAPKGFVQQKLNAISAFYKSKIEDFGTRCSLDHNYEIIETFEKQLFESSLPFRVEWDAMAHFDDVVFEGSQGILLDMDHGIFPHVTYANTTSKNALRYFTAPDIYYVTRCYQTRHGPGWMSNGTHYANDPMVDYSDIKLINNSEEINTFNEWQQGFRVGELDYALLNHAIRVDRSHWHYKQNILIDTHLVVTCLDQRPDFLMNYSQIQDKHKILENRSPLCDNMTSYDHHQ